MCLVLVWLKMTLVAGRSSLCMVGGRVGTARRDGVELFAEDTMMEMLPKNILTQQTATHGVASTTCQTVEATHAASSSQCHAPADTLLHSGLHKVLQGVVAGRPASIARAVPQKGLPNGDGAADEDAQGPLAGRALGSDPACGQGSWELGIVPRHPFNIFGC